MKTKFYLVILISLIIFGCTSMNEDYQSKFDSHLRMELSDESKQDSDEIIKFFGKCNTEISTEMRSELEATGVSIESVIKDIFTASGTRQQLIELAKLESVIRLEKSQMNKPMNKVN